MKKIFILLFAAAVVVAVSCSKDNPSSRSDMVDLGLSVKWATCNLGATKPEEFGTYFAWGDITGQTWDGSKWSGKGFSLAPSYEVDANNNLKPAYDAAHVKLGGNWRMPTINECEELIRNCTWTWTDNYNGTGVAGSIFTSKKTGYTNKSIFLPAAGSSDVKTLSDTGLHGRYWSSSLIFGSFSRYLYFRSDAVDTNYIVSYPGFSIRPVSD